MSCRISPIIRRTMAQRTKAAQRKASTEVQPPPLVPNDESINTRKGRVPSGVPGVWVNAQGDKYNAAGQLMSHVTAALAEEAHEIEVLGDGEPVGKSPARYLRYIALNKDLPRADRMEGAKHAAPYYDRKQPTAIDGGINPTNGAPLPLIPSNVFANLSDEDVAQVRKVLEKLKGV